MALFRVIVKRSAEKELRHISYPYLGQILKKIQSLASHSRPAGVEILKGEGRYLRIRQGDCRIVYEVDDKELEIIIIKVGHRRDVYQGL